MHFVFTNVTLIRIALIQYFLRKIFIVSIIFQGFPHRLLHNIIYIMLWRKLNCAHVFYWEEEHSEGTNDTLGSFLSCVPLSCGPLSSMSSVGLKDIYPIMKCLLYYWGMAKRKKSKKGREIERQRGISKRVMWTQASKFYIRPNSQRAFCSQGSHPVSALSSLWLRIIHYGLGITT